ncbi:eukaryotic translation initiation factor 4E-binding protein Mextli isoform X2 [Eurosta solidaginis]|uniref:eukaryotic translation initiation factor 4E-binding protein Mextli isoform X2 n=1 Tax=Eurosta solidaginis TaxID=178769 RepID=UPI00353177FB
MAHIGRTVKNVEAPRPLKSQSRSSLKNNYMLVEELIQLIENVALTLQSGINNTEPMAALVQNLRIHGPQLETVSKDTLDRAFVVFRNASQDERLNIMTRLNLLELIELRAKGWEDNGFNSYYKTKQVTNIDLPDGHIDLTQTGFLSTSPTFGGAGAAAAAAIAAVGSAQQTQLLLAPGEVIRNSGKFPKPTKIPGKTYCKDEVVIRNADSGKVNPGAKERLVQITGPTEEKINYAKQLIEDTIRRNASPVRLDPAINSGHAGGGGSCSSLASSNSDEAVTPRTPGVGVAGNSNLTNRLSFNSAQNFMTASAAAAAAAAAQQQQVMNMMGAVVGNTSTPTVVAAAAAAAGKVLRPNQQILLHSFSTNDASLGEYKYTVNVGQHLIRITGDCCDLVRVAKLVLDDYFSSAEFLASVEAGAAFDGSIVSPISTPSTPMAAAPQFMMGTPLHSAAPPLADSGIGLNYMATQGANYGVNDGDDEVFADTNAASQSNNGLSRSRRSHFSRKDSTPEAAAGKNENAAISAVSSESTRIVHEYEHLLYYAKSPHSWALPAEWQKICEKCPAIVRNKGFFNRQIVSIDEEGYDALQQQQLQLQQQPYTTERYYNHNNTNTNSCYRTYNLQQQTQQQCTDTNANNCNQQQHQIHYQQHLTQKQHQQQQLLQQHSQQLQYAQHTQQQYAQNLEQQQDKLVSMRTSPTTCAPSYVVNTAPSYSAGNVGAMPTNNVKATFHNNGNVTNIAPIGSSLENKPQKLLNKQIKMISSIMVGATHLTETTNEQQMNNSIDSINKQNKTITENTQQSYEPTTTTRNEKLSNNNDSRNKKSAVSAAAAGVKSTGVAAHIKESKHKSRSKSRPKKAIGVVVDDDYEENWDTDASDVEFVCETKYTKPDIVITADVKANQRRATERPKFMRSNSTCN